MLRVQQVAPVRQEPLAQPVQVLQARQEHRVTSGRPERSEDRQVRPARAVFKEIRVKLVTVELQARPVSLARQVRVVFRVSRESTVRQVLQARQELASLDRQVP